MKSNPILCAVFLSSALLFSPAQADDSRLAELKAKIKEVEKRAQQDPAYLEVQSALKQASEKLNAARETASTKLGLTEEIKATKKEADATNDDSKAAIVAKLKELESQVKQDTDLQSALEAYREAKAKARTVLRETMDRLDPSTPDLISEAGNLENAKRAPKDTP